MKEYATHLSKNAQLLLPGLEERAAAIDKKYKPYIYTNEEGVMERSLRFEKRLSKWMEDYTNRLEFYAQEEAHAWLKNERDTILSYLAGSGMDDLTEKYYKCFLKIIKAELERKDTAGENNSSIDNIRENVISNIKDNKLEQALIELESWLENQKNKMDLYAEVILHHAALQDLLDAERQNTIPPAEVRQEEARLRSALIKLAMEL